MNRIAAKHWHLALVEQCRPYRETHLPVLRAVQSHMVGTYGLMWWTNKDARALALNTLNHFGVNIKE